MIRSILKLSLCNRCLKFPKFSGDPGEKSYKAVNRLLLQGVDLPKIRGKNRQVVREKCGRLKPPGVQRGENRGWAIRILGERQVGRAGKVLKIKDSSRARPASPVNRIRPIHGGRFKIQQWKIPAGKNFAENPACKFGVSNFSLTKTQTCMVKLKLDTPIAISNNELLQSNI